MSKSCGTKEVVPLGHVKDCSILCQASFQGEMVGICNLILFINIGHY